jgi:hypothetical protein
VIVPEIEATVCAGIALPAANENRIPAKTARLRKLLCLRPLFCDVVANLCCNSMAFIAFPLIFCACYALAEAG